MKLIAPFVLYAYNHALLSIVLHLPHNAAHFIATLSYRPIRARLTLNFETRSDSPASHITRTRGSPEGRRDLYYISCDIFASDKIRILGERGERRGDRETLIACLLRSFRGRGIIIIIARQRGSGAMVFYHLYAILYWRRRCVPENFPLGARARYMSDVWNRSSLRIIGK